ncbi:hypothetical protein DJ568_00805 [Mucilaginibacter hurinus]|uniref:TonB C-terminal domain-containing protein n=1 Tax=Mucilaginibacter hurinus TaxID=2201324 RepID=A0A367GUF9_9SPHI|nr:M56 family metallopeptidase [Mucilaginibacter hurinus]RCH56431.1 hypothetical protein DJ568_00805 [Mucilaginibacter hurinus]
MSWLYYLLEANLYLCLFYAGYYLFLSKETFYTANRTYLLLSCVAAFTIPFLQISFLNSAADINVVGSYVTGSASAINTGVDNTLVFTWQSALLFLYIGGIVTAFILFSIKIYKLLSLIKKYEAVPKNGYKVIYINEANTAFSFFNYLFISKNTAGADVITSHEVVHIRHKHSFDILFIELLKIFNWFNPLIYLLQNSIKTLHEYIADDQTARIADNKLAYSTFLLNNAYGVQGMSPSNSFFNYNLLKNRIIMLNQKRSGKLARLKYLVAIPLCGAMLCASTLSFSKDYGFVDLLPPKESAKALHQGIAADSTPAKSSKKAMKPVVTDIKLTAKNKTSLKDTVVYTEVTLLPPDDHGKPFAEKQKPVKVNVQLLSPPEPRDTATIVVKAIDPFDSLLKHMSRFTRYPAVAFDNKTVGAVNINFVVDDKGKITDVKLFSGIGDRCDEEVIRVANKYTETIHAKPGPYTLSVVFTLIIDDNRVITGKLPIPHIAGQSAGVTYVNGFLKK